MCNFPAGQFLGGVFVVVIVGRNGIPSPCFGNPAHHRDVPDSRGSMRVANKSSTWCLCHGFSLVKSLKKPQMKKIGAFS